MPEITGMAMKPLLTRFSAWFLYAFLADGLISITSEVFTAAGLTIPGLDILRTVVATIVALWAVIVFTVIFLTPRLSKRLLLPSSLFALWASFGSGFPLTLWDFPYTSILLSAAQAGLGIVLFLAWKKQKQPLWYDEQPAFTWANFAAGAAASIAFFFFCLASLVTTAADAIENHTGGYAQLRPSGFYLEERTFRKDDKEVRLVGMVHIAREGFYDSIASDLRSTNSAIVLLEGVSDEKGLLKTRLSYSGLADFMGISSQEKSTFTAQASHALNNDGPSQPNALEYQQADLDISALQPQTLALIEALGQLLSSKSIQEALTHLQNKNSPLNDEAGMKTAMQDLIHTRNDHLMASLQNALASTNLVIVPWGAAHLPDLQKDLEEMGFRQVSEKARQALAFIP